MITVKREVVFDAAHFLPNYEGKCKNMHGHRWTLKVYVRGFNPDRVGCKDENGVFISGSQKGMIMDFSVLNKVLNNVVVEKFDHTVVNDIIEVPTAENMIMHFRRLIMSGLPDGIELVKLKLYETPASCAIWETK
jgi:6-pyruvoyltetrahydropterin/6-carboxytetrahydropterin synthase